MGTTNGPFLSNLAEWFQRRCKCEKLTDGDRRQMQHDGKKTTLTWVRWANGENNIRRIMNIFYTNLPPLNSGSIHSWASQDLPTILHLYTLDRYHLQGALLCSLILFLTRTYWKDIRYETPCDILGVYISMYVLPTENKRENYRLFFIY